MHSFRWTNKYLCAFVCISPIWSVFAYKNSTDESVQNGKKLFIQIERYRWREPKSEKTDFNCESRGCWILTRFLSKATQLILFWLHCRKKNHLDLIAICEKFTMQSHKSKTILFLCWLVFAGHVMHLVKSNCKKGEKWKTAVECCKSRLIKYWFVCGSIQMHLLFGEFRSSRTVLDGREYWLF